MSEWYGPLEISPSGLAAALPRAVRYRLEKSLLLFSATARADSGVRREMHKFSGLTRVPHDRLGTQLQ
jgi:hypothetical protein